MAAWQAITQTASRVQPCSGSATALLDCGVQVTLLLWAG